VLPPSLVAVTGANGIIGTHCVLALLKQGYHVRAVIRDPTKVEKTEFIKDAAKKINALDKLTFAAGDLLKSGSYDQAFQGCDAVIHTAAVVEVTDTSDAENRIVKPSVEGTRNVLSSISKSPCVRRYVHTSSVAAIQSFEEEKPESYTFTEKDWNTWSTIENGDPYGYAKAQAEKLVWDEKNAGKLGGCEVVAINPGVVLGPVFCKAHTKSSCVLVRQVMFNNPLINYNCTFVDVREVAQAFVQALRVPEAAGKRFIVLDGIARNTMDIVPLAQSAYPDFRLTSEPLYSPFKLWLIHALGSLPLVGNMVISEYNKIMTTRKVHFSCKRSQEVLGIKYRPLEETVTDTIDSMKTFVPLKKKK